MSLEKDLNELRSITIELMDKVENQGNRLFLLKKRDDLLVKIKNANYDMQELKDNCESLEIYELDTELKNRVSKEMESIKQEIKMLKRSHQGNKAYLSSRYGSGVIYSRFDKKY
ncbi:MULTISPECIES: flagellar protein FliT [Clostridium]|uniref:flagellar protein FliT n=1 Tax=Clostridium TaxID=1485 RepID=UPI0005FB17C8|nr:MULTISPECIES: flagellar protein FliT [Clostridium]MDU0322323.1 flagellar protein FliT [Clostridium butyricum]